MTLKSGFNAVFLTMAFFRPATLAFLNARLGGGARPAGAHRRGGGPAPLAGDPGRGIARLAAKGDRRAAAHGAVAVPPPGPVVRAGIFGRGGKLASRVAGAETQISWRKIRYAASVPYKFDATQYPIA